MEGLNELLEGALIILTTFLLNYTSVKSQYIFCYSKEIFKHNLIEESNLLGKQ